VLAEGRRAALFYATSKENAIRIRDEIRSHGRTCESLTSDNAHETDRIFEAFRAGRLWSIVSVGMLTTGTNFPFVDFISLILSTKSPGKLVQILGRGTRNSPGKEDCLIADHGKNLAYHGPIDQISPKAPGSGDGDAPKKVCPDENTPGAVKDENGAWGCGELIHASAKTCQCCGYVFPPSQEVSITATAADAPVLSIEKPTWRPITKRTFRFHEGKGEKPPSVKCTYFSGLTQFNEWLCFEHSGFAQSKAHRWWSQHGGERPFPSTVMAALERQGELVETASISVRPDGKYWSVVGHQVAAAVPVASNDNHPVASNDNVDYGALMEDEIPF
jgi:DNA repair protein RadD